MTSSCNNRCHADLFEGKGDPTLSYSTCSNQDSLPTLDAHGHLDSSKPQRELDDAGAVLAMTLSLDEAEAAQRHQTSGRTYPNIVWGAGCHPGALDAQEAFDPERFRRLAEKTAVIGEIGLDQVSAVPLEWQVHTFRAALATAADLGRPVSIHNAHATGLVLDELERDRPPAVILHGWTGSVAETERAVALGCWFSVNLSAIWPPGIFARVPISLVLVETDWGYENPPAGIPPLLMETESLVAVRYEMDEASVRRQVWKNFSEIVRRTGIGGLLPERIAAALKAVQG
jgi:TatD DNase family protein